MDNSRIKKKWERQIIHRFSQDYKSFPHCKIVDSETPDFLLKLNRRTTYGLELTELIPSDLLFEHQLDIPLTKHFGEEFNVGTQPFSLHLNLQKKYYINRFLISLFQKKDLAVISNSVCKLNPNQNSFISFSKKVLSKHIQQISISYHPEDKLMHWSICRQYEKKKDVLQLIQNRLDKKEEKLRAYRQNILDQYWLILFIDCSKCLVKSKMDQLLEKNAFNSGFDRVLLYDYFNRNVFPINTTK